MTSHTCVGQRTVHSHGYVPHPGDLELHLLHAPDGDAVTPGGKPQQPLLHVLVQAHHNIPEIPGSKRYCKSMYVSITCQPLLQTAQSTSHSTPDCHVQVDARRHLDL